MGRNTLCQTCDNDKFPFSKYTVAQSDLVNTFSEFFDKEVIFTNFAYFIYLQMYFWG